MLGESPAASSLFARLFIARDTLVIRGVALNSHDSAAALEQKVTQVLLSHLATCAGLCDLDGRVLALTPAALDSVGVAADELLGIPLWQGNWWRGSAAASQVLRSCKLAASGRPFHAYLPLGGGGAVEPTAMLDYRLTPVHDEHGAVVLLLAEWHAVNPAPAAPPLAPHDAQTAAQPSTPPAPAKPHCLVVAAEEGRRRAIGAALESHFQISATAGLAEAAALCRDRPPQLVVAALAWPDPDDGARRLRAGAPDSVLVLMLPPTAGIERLELLEDLADECLTIETPAPELALRCRKLVAARGQREHLARSVSELETKARAAEAQLALSEARFQMVVDSVQDYALYMLDSDGFVVSWNSGAERLTGFAEHEAIGRHYTQVCAPANAGSARPDLELERARLEGRADQTGERLRKDGSVYIAQHTLSRINEHAGAGLGYVSIIRDITQAERAALALAESEAKFRTIVDAVPQMVWSASPDGRHDYYNRQWYEYTGTEPGATDGDQWERVFHPDDHARAWRLWRNSLSSGQPYEVYYRLWHHSGGYRWALGRANPIRDETGEIIRWMGTCTDIDEQKQLEQALATQSRRKDEYLAMLAHELRNPLGPLANSAAILRFAVADGDACGGLALEVIERQIRHMSRLIDDLLDVARLSRNKIVLGQAPCELVRLCQQTFDDYHSYFDQARVNAQLELPPEPLYVMGDAARLTQIMGNLLHNAAKFCEPGGGVRAVLRRSEHNALFEVTDTGVGIEPDLLVQLFDPFVQANQGLARSKGGLGLGLALARGFAELHGGCLTAASGGLGSGAKFTLTLPLLTLAPPVAEPAPLLDLGQLDLVVIDDNRDMAISLKQLLELDGHRVEVAFDGISGLALIERIQPQAVVCDIGLPLGMDGFEVAKAVRAQPRLARIALVALSGYGQPQDVEAAHAAGFDVHLLKPAGFAELTAALAGAVRKYLS